MAEAAETKDGPNMEDEEAVSTLYSRPPSTQHECRRTGTPCSSCKQLLRLLGYSREADRFFDKGYVNWMKACMVLQYAKEGIEISTEDVAKQLHATIATNIGNKIIDEKCPGCEDETTGKQKKQKCKECNAWIKAIGKYGRTKKTQLNWLNTTLKSVKQKPWDLAKLFQADGCQSHEGPEQCDIAAILSFMSNCKYCKEYLNEDDDSDGDNEDEFDRLVTVVRTNRNNIHHSNSLKIVDDMILKDHIEDVLKLLNQPKKLKEESRCTIMRQKIEWVRDNKIIPNEEDEQRIMNSFVSDMNGKRNSYERQLENATTAEEYLEIQDKIKKNEDTSRRLGFFVDMNLIENPDLRQTLKSIEDECSRMYLEAERRLVETNMKDRFKRDKGNYLRELTPGKPRVIQNERDQIELTWEKPERFDGNGYYQLRYKEKSKTAWNMLTFGNEKKALLNDMKSDAVLIFQVRQVTDDVVGPYSEDSDEVWTQATAGNALLDKAKLYKDSRPAVYTVPMTEKNTGGCLRTFGIGSPTTSTGDLHIWLFGETESVRTTMVDSMLNFIVGINWDDDYRLTVQNTDSKKTDQNLSNGEDFIANYIIYPAKGSRVNHVVSIMNSPTLEHVENIYTDKLFGQLYELLSGKNVGMICVVVKASESQMNAAQILALEAVLSLFGNDLKYNICVLVLCSDEVDSTALQTNINSNIALEKCFVFSNAGLAVDHTDKGLPRRDLWRTNWETYVELFQFVDKKACQTTDNSLKVLKIRKSLRSKTLTVKTNDTDCTEKEIKLKYALEKYPNYVEDDDDGDEDAICEVSYAEDIIASENMKHSNHYYPCINCQRDTMHRIYCPFCCNPRSRVSYKRERENMKKHHKECENLQKNIDTLKQDIDKSKQEIECTKEELVHIALHP